MTPLPPSGASNACLDGSTPDVLRPGFVGMRGSVVLRTAAMHYSMTPPSLGARDVCLVGENWTCFVPAL